MVSFRGVTKRYGVNLSMSARDIAQVASRVPPGLPPDLQALFEEMLNKAPVFIDRRSGADLISE